MSSSDAFLGARVATLVIALFSALAPAGAVAQEGEPSLGAPVPEDTEVIVVSATRGRHDLSTLPMSATVLSGKELDEAPDYALDGALRNVPGVFVTTRSSAVTHPTAQAISMRGLGGSRALVLLDGVPVNDGFGGWINWSKLPIRNLERVEVVRGAGASLWGNYAMGGVVNVVTRPADERAVIARGSYGSFNTGTADAYVSDVTGDTGVSLRYRFFDTDGYKVVEKGKRGSVDRKASSESHFLDGRIDHAFSDNTRAQFTLTLFDEDRNVGTEITDNSRKSLDTALRLTHDAEELGQFRLSVFGSAQQFDNNNSCVDPETITCRDGPRQSESRIIRQDIPTGQVGAFAEWSKSFEPWDTLLTAGLDFQHVQARNREDFFAPYPFPGARSTSGKQETLGGYVQAELYPLDNLEVLASIRVDYWRTFDGEQRNNREGFDSNGLTRFRDQSEVEVSPRLSLRYAVDESLALRGGIYRAFRAPNLNELYRGFFAGGRVFSGNPELGSELLRIGGELGFDWTFGPATLHVTGYWNELDDFIDFVFSGGAFVRQNFTQVRARGVEIELPIQLTETILIAPSYVFADSTIQKFGGTASDSRVGNQIRNVPRDTFLFTARYDDPELFMLEFQGRYIGVSYGDDRNTTKLDPHFVLDVSLTKKLGEHWEVFLMAQNITDEVYVARRVGDLGTIGMPQNFWGGVRLDW